jgi:hypothetical protein
MATRKRATQPAASAPVSDAAIAARTGRTWAEWVDGAGARDLSHTAIAALKQKKVWAKSLRDLAELAAAD